MKVFLRLVGFELRLHARHRTEWAALVLFFLVMVVLLPFAIGPDAGLQRRLAPGLIWLGCLLMNLLALDKLFAADARDGTLDIMLLSPLPLPLTICSKLMAQSLAMLAALALMVLPAGLLLNLDFRVLPVLLAGFALGVPSLVFLGGLVSAIAIGLPRNPALLTLLMAPFFIPVLIFAVSAVDAALLGYPSATPLLLLGALLAVVAPVAPFAIAAALRNAEG